MHDIYRKTGYKLRMWFVGFILLQNIIHEHPYHIDSLIQLSEIFRMSEDLQTAVDLIGKVHKTKDKQENNSEAFLDTE